MESTDTSLAGAYKVNFFAWQGAYQAETAVASFTVSILQPCLSPTLTPSVLADQTYILMTSALYAIVPAFTSAPAYCPISYQLTTQDDKTIDPSLISFNPTTRLISVEYLDITNFSSKAGDYILKLTGTSFTKSSSLTFTLKVIDPCFGATIQVESNFWTDFTQNIY